MITTSTVKVELLPLEGGFRESCWFSAFTLPYVGVKPVQEEKFVEISTFPVFTGNLREKRDFLKFLLLYRFYPKPYGDGFLPYGDGFLPYGDGLAPLLLLLALVLGD